jgi:D-alanine transaminase
MPRVSYVNGLYLPHGAAAVHVEDRGYQFADGVYEVISVHGGEFIDLGPHFDRLGRSLDALRISWPMSRAALRVVLDETVRRNCVRDGIVYLQVTRGTAPRAHAFPADARPQLVVTARPMALLPDAAREAGVAVTSVPDIRWGRCDIKSVALLANVLAKQEAVETGAYEAWLVDSEGAVTEGSASNAWIVAGEGTLVTRNLGRAILGGITRASVLEGCAAAGVRVAERPFTLKEALAAREALLTSTTSFVLPVVRIDGQAVGDGRPGPVFRQMDALYRRRAGIESLHSAPERVTVSGT